MDLSVDDITLKHKPWTPVFPRWIVKPVRFDRFL
jgi:hypothetical protein